jgi:hypothetical protein
MNWDVNKPEEMAQSVEWMRTFVKSIRQGGAWIVPRSLSIYVIDHEHKVATKRWGFPDPAITKVFEGIGWRVVDASVDHNESPPFAGLRKEHE